MRIIRMKKISFIVASILAFIIAAVLVCMIAEGKNVLFAEDFEGRIYSAERGYFEAGGKTYYAHYSKSQMYDKGELLTNGYRVRNGKLYYFGPDGAMITRKTSRNRTTRYIDFNKDGSVHYVYPAGRGEVVRKVYRTIYKMPDEEVERCRRWLNEEDEDNDKP